MELRRLTLPETPAEAPCIACPRLFTRGKCGGKVTGQGMISRGILHLVLFQNSRFKKNYFILYVHRKDL